MLVSGVGSQVASYELRVTSGFQPQVPHSETRIPKLSGHEGPKSRRNTIKPLES